MNNIEQSFRKNRFTISLILTCIGLLSAATQAMAHHPTGGKTPDNFFTGFLSGLAHPIIGLDHLAFIVAIGLLSVGFSTGALVPLGFVFTALAGTGIHLLQIDLPASEIVIAASAIAFGTMLLTQKRPNLPILATLASFAGFYHGYAYGESIIGASMLPLFAYLLGFSLVQYGIALLALLIGNWTRQKFTTPTISPIQIAGFVICSIGMVFLTTSLTS
jgi:urease accessory protein